MNTLDYLDKLSESSRKRDELRRDLEEYLLTNQQNLPQELIAAWGGFERLELEARATETKAIKRIEPELQKAQSVISNFPKLEIASRISMVSLFSLFIGLTIFLIFYACEPEFLNQKERKVAQESNVVIVGEGNE